MQDHFKGYKNLKKWMILKEEEAAKMINFSDQVKERILDQNNSLIPELWDNNMFHDLPEKMNEIYRDSCIVLRSLELMRNMDYGEDSFDDLVGFAQDVDLSLCKYVIKWMAYMGTVEIALNTIDN